MSRPTDSADRYSDAQWERRDALIARDEQSENEEASAATDEDEDEGWSPTLLIRPLCELLDSDGSTMTLNEYFERYEDHTSKEDAAIRALKVGDEVSFDKPVRFSIRRVS
jgi:hypothetical protein